MAVRFSSLLPLGRPTIAELRPLVVVLGKIKLNPLSVIYPANARKLIAQRANPVDSATLDFAFLFARNAFTFGEIGKNSTRADQAGSDHKHLTA